MGPWIELEIDEALAKSVISWRRTLHQHPELGFELPKTRALVRNALESLGLEVHELGGGLVAVLEGEEPGPTLAWRADMDALPIHEEAARSFRSKVEGRMHACGHDGHTAVGLGVVSRLSQERARLRGRRVFIFQPNEEGAPGAGPAGAVAMVEAGALTRFQVEEIYALHVMPSLEVGVLGWNTGAAWASSDRLEITLSGRGTHAAYPHLGDDLIAAAARMVLALQALPSRRIDPRERALVSFGQIHAGTNFNVIPPAGSLVGIVRALDEEVRASLHEAIRREVQGIAQACGVEAKVALLHGADVVVNDPGATARAVALLQSQRRLQVREVLPQLGAEDFAAFSRQVPGVYFVLGVGGQGAAPLHSPHFLMDEGALIDAVSVISSLLLSCSP